MIKDEGRHGFHAYVQGGEPTILKLEPPLTAQFRSWDVPVSAKHITITPRDRHPDETDDTARLREAQNLADMLWVVDDAGNRTPITVQA